MDTIDAETGRELMTSPTEPGWYVYYNEDTLLTGMVFHLRKQSDGELQWSAHFDNGDSGDCVWGYIEQGLGVFNLVRLVPEKTN